MDFASLGGPLRYFEVRFKYRAEFSIGTQNFNTRIFEVLLDPPPPLERKSFVGCVKLIIPKVTALSMQKRDCEKYLFQRAIGGLV
jgi:hypothetical protein